jgi:7-cyano-7-deazaguanine reductase
MKNVSEIASKHLGQVGGAGYKDQYDPELLVAIPRSLNREAYGIDSKNLPFHGMDVWNAYEVSFLTNKGLPVSGAVKITLPADSEFHVESKSLKLYLNSFNMTELGPTILDAIHNFKDKVVTDLSKLLQCDVWVFFYGFDSTDNPVGLDMSLEEIGEPSDIDSRCNLESIDFKEGFTGFDLHETDSTSTHYWKSNLLRSNCRVTNQPDWGDIYIVMKGTKIPTPESLAKYIVSHRQVSHFHEEICEMLFTTLQKECELEDLMVTCLYTRRGGIDINPMRTTNLDWIPKPFRENSVLLKKTLRQ